MIVRLLCEYSFPGKEQPLCWLPSNHQGRHQRKYEVDGLEKEWAKVLEAEKKKKRGDEW